MRCFTCMKIGGGEEFGKKKTRNRRGVFVMGGLVPVGKGGGMGGVVLTADRDIFIQQ